MDQSLKQKVHDLVYSRKFEFLIMIIILINCVAIGMKPISRDRFLPISILYV